MSPEVLREALDLVHAILSEGWEPQRLDEHSWGFRHVAGWVPLSCYAEINPQIRAFLFRAINALPVDPERRGAVAEYIARVNYTLPVGNWAIDLDTGDVRWKSGFYFGEGELRASMVREVIGSSLFFIGQHIFGIAKLQTGGTMAEALATIGQDQGVGVADGMKGPG